MGWAVDGGMVVGGGGGGGDDGGGGCGSYSQPAFDEAAAVDQRPRTTWEDRGPCTAGLAAAGTVDRVWCD